MTPGALFELPCADVVELVTDYLEDRLSAEDRRRFDEHLETCPHCSEYLQQMRVTVAALGRLEFASLDPRLLSELAPLVERYRA